MKKVVFALIVLAMAPVLTAQSGTLKDKNGQIMRGTPMIIGKPYQNTSVAFSANINNWRTLRDTYKMNTVRLCWVDPWFKDEGQANWGVFEALPHIEKAVANATATGMNIIINYHNTGEQIRKGKDLSKNQALRVTFWRNIAKKFKDNDRVFFELSNEPVFNTNDYNNPEFKKNLLDIYYLVRFEAPNRQILLFSFNQASYNIKSVVDEYKNAIDWSKTSIAWHAYTMNGTSNRIKAVNKQYRTICTEWDYPGTHDYVGAWDGFGHSARALENSNTSWIDWRSWGDNTLNEVAGLRTHAQTNGYWWGGGSGTGAGSGRTVSLRKGNATNFAVDGNVGGANGQNTYLWRYNSGNINQKWEEIDRGNGFFSYKKKNTNFCIDGNNGGANGQNVYLYTCNANNQNQQWKKVNVGSGKFRLEKRNAAGFSLDGGNGGANGQNLYLYASNNNNQNQQWAVGAAATNLRAKITVAEPEGGTSLLAKNPIAKGGVIELNLKTDNSANVQVSILDMWGRVLFTQEFNDNETDRLQLRYETSQVNIDAVGVYFVRVELDGDTKVQKLLVQ